ncbi:helix-turn-helix domain-containing protein [Mucilaginibacter dorajii]|uniref:helix-turn-helix domain-containing protein n=2 Tax=Mucilaginibacter dorajii TaxID=692994 RepID=UPI003CD09B4A
MNQNYMFNVSVEAFAKLTGRSVSSFKRDFAKTFQTTPKNWLREKRLDEAMYRIRQKQERPADFYLDLGFENLSHFYYAFKQKFGSYISYLRSSCFRGKKRQRQSVFNKNVWKKLWLSNGR